jgi:hypothetical protein
MLNGRELSEQLCDDAVAPMECDVPNEMSLGEWSESRRVDRPRRSRWWQAKRRSRRVAEAQASAGTGSSSAAPRSRSAK